MNTMDCEQVRKQFSARIDGRLDASSHAEVETHLAACSTCRQEWEAVEALHVNLSQALAGWRGASLAIADRAITDWKAEVPKVATRRLSLRTIAPWCLAVAACWLLLIGEVRHFQVPALRVPPLPEVATVHTLGEQAPDVRTTPSPAARLVVATGPVLFKPNPQAEWKTVPVAEMGGFTCPDASSVKTEAATSCELVSPAGVKVRLNEKTEVMWLTADELQLVEGQLWCRTPQQGGLILKTAEATNPTSAWTCAADSECLASLPVGGGTSVLTISGVVTGTMRDVPQYLTSGMQCASTGVDTIVRPSTDEVLRACRWTQPFLTADGHDNPELFRRVEALLAHLDSADATADFEQDLRHLGEFAALPLSSFLRTSSSEDERERRRTAMQILADVVPIWMVPDLIELLNDADGDIRAQAAEALTRLTGETQGLSPADWRSEQFVGNDQISAWRNWWIGRGPSCSLPPAGISPRSLSEPASPGPMLKVRN